MSNDGDDLLKLISDFLKGKAGPPDATMASFNLGENVNPENFAHSPLSKTFGDFSKEYKSVCRALKKYGRMNCLRIIGAMMTAPELQANHYRLEVLIHLAFLHAEGKSRPTPANVAAWFNVLDKGTCGRQEDATEDVFVAPVTFEGRTYRLFEGSAEGNRFHTQLFLTILQDMPNSGPYTMMKNGVRSILTLSELIAERFGVLPYYVGSTTPRSGIGKPSPEAWRELRHRVVFSQSALADHAIALSTLEPFFIQKNHVNELLDHMPGHSPLDWHPLILHKDELVVFHPTMIGTAIRHMMITVCQTMDMERELHSALANAYVKLFADKGLLKKNPPPLQMQYCGPFHAAQLVQDLDKGRYLHLIFFVDGFEGFREETFIGANPVDPISDYVGKSIEEAHKKCVGASDFREGLTLVIPCGWGRYVGFRPPELPQNWRIDLMPPHDALAFHDMPKFKTIDLFKVLDAQDAISEQNIALINANGIFNLWAWMMSNDGHIVQHEKLEHDFVTVDRPGIMHIPTNSLLDARTKSYFASDIRALQRPDGSFAEVQRAHATPRYGTRSLSPFYVDVTGYREGKYRNVYLSEKGQYWISVSTKDGLDRHSAYQLLSLTMHWAEKVFRMIDTQDETQHGVQMFHHVAFGDNDVTIDGSQPIPTDEEVVSLIERRSGTQSESVDVFIDVKKGFMSAGRRVDNFGERQLVGALISACVEVQGRKLNLDEVETLIWSVVKSENARHLHAFAEPDLRDYVRDDLPSPLVVEPLDDAFTRIGLGWSCRDRSEGHRIEGKGPCAAYLTQLLDVLAARFKERVATFDREALLERALLNHESCSHESDVWKRTFGAVEALSDTDDFAVQDASEEIGRLFAGSMASRIIAEAAICEAPLNKGAEPGDMDINRLLADASQMYHLGGYRAAMLAGIMPLEIVISPAGEVMMDHGFSDSVIKPFGQHFTAHSLAGEKRKYASRYEPKEASETPPDLSGKEQKDKDAFENAWLDEFGFCAEDMLRFIGSFWMILQTDRKPIIKDARSALAQRIGKDTELDDEIVGKCLDSFTLQPRPSWTEVPEGYPDNAWHPWRFQRQLSLVTKPVIQLNDEEDPMLMIAPAMCVQHLERFYANTLEGAYSHDMFRTNGKLYKLMDAINSEVGEEFNSIVAKKFVEIGWEAKPNQSDGQIFNRQKSRTWGDVDVLAWNKAGKRLLIIECKDLSFDKTIGEVANRLSKYQGVIKNNGKPDDLKKHLNRCEEIEANLDKVGEYVGMEIETVERVLLLSQPTPLIFAELADKHSVEVITFTGIETRFDEPSEGE
ncbi:hypothetical protein [Phaeobacter inhibens]|uniref:hypothetical protein n=1 Tax=Phaeobacter inhibens TaxID=221822 RepID=UPI000CA2CCF7|nr:hypothetical protein [Phaeobacter inhibens]AUR06987.1 hypothetical protein PhaeoP59_00787 [Phaeobacter inhibens]